MTVQWFGPSWGAPVCTPENEAPTPVGATCPQCDKPIEYGDYGLLIPHYDGKTTERLPWHIACFERHLMGGRRRP